VSPFAAPVLVAGLVAGLLAGCSGAEDDPQQPASPTESTSSAAPTPKPARTVPRPDVGACYRLEYDEAVAPTSKKKPVDCADEHTASTFHVDTIDAIADGHLLAVDSRQVQDDVAAECPSRFSRFVGGTLQAQRLTMLRAVWFTPTVPQSERGADWFRCDVIALAGDQTLAPLTGKLAGVLRTPEGRTRYGICGTAEPDAEDFERVICSAPHSWRAISTFTFDSPTYPGEQRVQDVGESTCEEAGRGAADDALNFRWGYEWPTQKQWDAGQTYGLCWAPE
jgi:Septum formation